MVTEHFYLCIILSFHLCKSVHINLIVCLSTSMVGLVLFIDTTVIITFLGALLPVW